MEEEIKSGLETLDSTLKELLATTKPSPQENGLSNENPTSTFEGTYLAKLNQMARVLKTRITP